MKGDELYEVRNLKLDHCTDEEWWWQKKDDGAWKGPHENWNGGHSKQYFDYVTSRFVVVTAGGNMGLHTRAYASMFERVYVFEPDNLNFTALVRNCQYENVYFFRAGLGESSGLWGHVQKSSQENNTGMHQVAKMDGGQLPIMSIDSLNLDKCDLIQLDIEGGEPLAIRGAEQTINRCRPVIITEGNHSTVRTPLYAKDYIEVGHSHADYIYVPKEKYHAQQ